jgi:hypothetical protein
MYDAALKERHHFRCRARASSKIKFPKLKISKLQKIHLGKFQNLKAPKEFPKSGGCDLVDLKAASLLWCIRARNPNAISS